MGTDGNEPRNTVSQDALEVDGVRVAVAGSLRYVGQRITENFIKGPPT
jgi:hypothetical protein